MGRECCSGLIPEFPDAIRRKISVEGGPADPEMIDDIPDKRVVYRVLEHCLGDAGFLLVQYPRPSAPAPALSSCREAGLGVFDDQLALKFIEGGRDMEKQPSLGRAGVDIACQYLERLFLLLQFVGGLNDLLERPCQPGEPPDHQGIARAHVFERGFEFRAVTMRARCFLDIEPFAPGLFQGVDL